MDYFFILFKKKTFCLLHKVFFIEKELYTYILTKLRYINDKKQKKKQIPNLMKITKSNYVSDKKY